MADVRPLREVFDDLVSRSAEGSVDAVGAGGVDGGGAVGDLLRAGGHGDLPPELVAEAVLGYAQSAPLDVAERLSAVSRAWSEGELDAAQVLPRAVGLLAGAPDATVDVPGIEPGAADADASPGTGEADGVDGAGEAVDGPIDDPWHIDDAWGVEGPWGVSGPAGGDIDVLDSPGSAPPAGHSTEQGAGEAAGFGFGGSRGPADDLGADAPPGIPGDGREPGDEVARQALDGTLDDMAGEPLGSPVDVDVDVPDPVLDPDVDPGLDPGLGARSDTEPDAPSADRVADAGLTGPEPEPDEPLDG